MSQRHMPVLACFILVVAASFLLALWLTRGADLKDQLPVWDLFLKAVGGLLALSGAALAVLRYFDDRARALDTASIEARKPFFTKQQQVYGDLLAATGAVSTIEDYEDPASVAAERQFWTVFWGSLPMVTDERVAVEADRFAALLAPRSEDWIALRNAGMDLSRACRASLGFEGPLPAKAQVTTRADARPGA